MFAHNPFIPASVIAARAHKFNMVLIVLLAIPLIFYHFTWSQVAASTSHTWTASDFGLGTATSTTAGTMVSLHSSATQLNLSRGYSNPHTLGRVGKGGTDQNPSLVLTRGYGINKFTNPSLQAGATNGVNQVRKFGNLLYLAEDDGLTVIDTQGTASPVDDTFVARYNTASAPALVGNDQVFNVNVVGNLIYVSTNGGGLSVINTQGTTGQGDDVLVVRYHTGSSPALNSGIIYSSYLVGNLLYVNTYNGLSVINTQGTTAPGDDVLVVRYHTASSPALTNSGMGNNVLHSVVNGNLLYVSTYGGGVTVINTQGTTVSSDDVVVARYNTTATPSLMAATNYVYHLTIAGDLLYVSTIGQGIVVIDTKGTPDSADDTLVTTYTTATTPALAGNTVYNTVLDGDLLYVSTYQGGLTIIDTKGTETVADDELLVADNDTSDSLRLDENVTSVYVDNDYIYVGVSNPNNSVVVLPKTGYVAGGSYVGLALSPAEAPTIAVTAEVTADHNVDLYYRTGGVDAVWNDDFSTTTGSYAGDLYTWGNPFESATSSDDVLQLSGIGNAYTTGYGTQGVNFWIGTGKPAGHFPVGTTINARVRVNSDTATFASNPSSYMFSDDWWEDNGGNSFVRNEWVTLNLKVNFDPLTNVGFQVEWDTGTWAPTDTFEIDWIEIMPPESAGEWGAWQSCVSYQSCAVDSADLVGQTWLQYRVDLETTNPLTTPSITDVSLAGDYTPTGTYTSETKDLGTEQELLTFEAVTDVPSGTSISFEYSIDGAVWEPITPGGTFTPGTISSQFTWRAELLSTDPELTPTITSVTITGLTALATPVATSNGSSATATDIIAQVNFLEEHGNFAKADELRKRFPHMFTESGEPILTIQYEIVEKAEEVVSLLQLLVEKRREEVEN
jgi:hypothetical protein